MVTCFPLHRHHHPILFQIISTRQDHQRVMLLVHRRRIFRHQQMVHLSMVNKLIQWICKHLNHFYHGRSLNDDQLFLVIYVVDTFRYELTGLSNNENENINIDDTLDVYIKKAIFRAYMDLVKDLPEKISNRINSQVEIKSHKIFDRIFRLDYSI